MGPPRSRKKRPKAISALRSVKEILGSRLQPRCSACHGASPCSASPVRLDPPAGRAEPGGDLLCWLPKRNGRWIGLSERDVHMAPKGFGAFVGNARGAHVPPRLWQRFIASAVQRSPHRIRVLLVGSAFPRVTSLITTASKRITPSAIPMFNGVINPSEAGVGTGVAEGGGAFLLASMLRA